MGDAKWARDVARTTAGRPGCTDRRTLRRRVVDAGFRTVAPPE